MEPLYKALDVLRDGVRTVMRKVAKAVNQASGGRVSPNAVTITSLLAHIPVAWLIATWHTRWAVLLLVIFGLFDALDGELARLQNSSSKIGMLLDSISDRFKEIILYIGITYAFAFGHRPTSAVWATAALGASLLVSYVNAWGEAVISTKHATNKAFRSGLLSFDLRMVLIVLGLLFNKLNVAVVIIALLALVTVFQRLNGIRKAL
ncbi:MAG: hypothetical protein JWS12_427 [Candidatus Saccharibacteria bacterium]|nr:hypothetical protein [Candidatus Saccharibacteria bacterium]